MTDDRGVDVQGYYGMVLYRLVSFSTLRGLSRRVCKSAPCKKDDLKYDCAFGLVDECFGAVKRLVFDSEFKGCETIVARNTRSYFLPVLEAVDAGRLGDVLHYPEDPPISIHRSDGMLFGWLGVEAKPVYGVKLAGLEVVWSF